MPSPPDSLIQLPSHSLSRSSFCGSARPMRQSVCRLSRGFGFSSLPSHNRSLQPRIMLCCSLPSHQQLSWAKPRLAALSASTGDGHNHAIHRNAPWNDILGGALRQVAQTKQTNRLLHQWKRTVGRGSGLAILKARAARCHCFHGSVCYFTRTWAVKHRRLSGASALHSVGCWTPKVGILCRRSTVLSRALPSDQRTEDQAESEANSNSSANTSSSNGTPGTGNDGKSPHGRDEEDPKQEPWRPWGWLSRILIAISMSQPFRVILNLVLVFFLVRLWPIGNREATAENAQSVVVVVPFSEFMQQVKSNDVEAITVDGVNLSYTLRRSSPRLKALQLPEGAENLRISYSTIRPADMPTPYETMMHNKIQFQAVDKRNNRLVSILMYALYIGLVLSFLNRFPLKMPQRSSARRYRGQLPNSVVTFQDVAGVDEAKEELAEVVEFLRAPERFARLGARPPSGVLLCGPPGTGKTLLAKAIAGEADVPFFSISASEFVELYVGMGAMRVRELFANARKEAPAIVFIDEIDAVAKGRDTRLRSVGNDEREQTLNQLLTELDGFESDKENLVICIAATNRADVLDPALLRPGRFDRRVAVERPDKIGRDQILRVHLQRRGLPLAEDVTVENLASATTGFTGADLANLVNEAALLAGRRNASTVSSVDFDNAILRAVAGVEKKRSILMGKEKSMVAKHEVGHALVGSAVSKLLPEMPKVERMSIVPRSGGSLGMTKYVQQEDRAMMFDTEMRAQLAVLLGGRAAEQYCCGHISTGASDDIQRATNIAQKAVAEWGLSTSIGPLNIATLASRGSEEILFRDNAGKLAELVDAEVKSLIEAALEVAVEVISSNKRIQEGLSAELEELEKMDGEPLQAWLGAVQVPNRLREYVLFGKMPGKRFVLPMQGQQ